MSYKERLELEKNEFQVLKKKYSFKNIQRVEEILKETEEDTADQKEITELNKKSKSDK